MAWATNLFPVRDLGGPLFYLKPWVLTQSREIGKPLTAKLRVQPPYASYPVEDALYTLTISSVMAESLAVQRVT